MGDLHVALVAPFGSNGGIATYSERLKNALEEIEVDVTPVQINNNRSSNPLAFIGLLDNIPDEADVVQVQFEAGLFGRAGMSGIGAPAFFLALARQELPVVVTLHEVHRSHVHRGPVGNIILQGRDFLIERLVLRAADATVVHSGEVQDILRARHGNRWRIDRMYHPVEIETEPISADDAKEELDMENQIVVTFGFVEDKKRYEDVIRVLPEFPDLIYLIAGGLRKGEGEVVLERCRELADELDVAERVRYLGYVPEGDVPVLFSASDAVVLPYKRVSQSGAINEALAYLRPVIATSLPAFEEIRQEFGCLLTYEGLDELIEALKSAVHDEEQRLQLRTSTEAYVKEVNWGNAASRTRDIFIDVTTTASSSDGTGNPG